MHCNIIVYLAQPSFKNILLVFYFHLLKRHPDKIKIMVTNRKTLINKKEGLKSVR